MTSDLVLVPRHATSEMKHAAGKVWGYDCAHDCWDLMIAASNPIAATSLLAEIERLRGALEPFAEFARGMPSAIPNDQAMTNGSPLARRQITAGHFRVALQALASKDTPS